MILLLLLMVRFMLAELSIEQAGSINVMTLMRHYID